MVDHAILHPYNSRLTTRRFARFVTKKLSKKKKNQETQFENSEVRAWLLIPLIWRGVNHGTITMTGRLIAFFEIENPRNEGPWKSAQPGAAPPNTPPRTREKDYDH